MSEEPAFLDIHQVEVLHRTALERHGGQDGVRDPAAFESAVMQPRNVWYCAQGDLFDVAAASFGIPNMDPVPPTNLPTVHPAFRNWLPPTPSA